MTADVDFQIESYYWILGFRGEEFVKTLTTTVTTKGIKAAERLTLIPNMPEDIRKCHIAAIQYIRAASPPTVLARLE